MATTSVNLMILIPILLPFTIAIIIFGLRKWLNNFAGEIASGAIIINIAIIAALNFRVQQTTSKILFGFYNTTAGIEYSSPLGVQLRVDGFIGWFLLFVNIIIVLVFAYEATNQRNKPEGTIYISLLLFITAGVNAVAFADDFFTLFLAWVIIGASLITLVVFKRRREDLREGGIRTYILVGLGLIFILLAVILSYGLFGSLNFDYIKSNITLLFSSRIQNATLLIYLIISLTIIGFGLFANIFLLNLWMPKAVDKAPASTQFFSFGIISGFSILSIVRVIYSLFNPSIFSSLNYPIILSIIGLITAIEGSLLLVYQVFRKDKENISLTKIITFMIFTNIGLIITGISVSGLLNTTEIDSLLTVKDCLGYSSLHLINLVITSYLSYTSKERLMINRNNSDKLPDLRSVGKEFPLTSVILVLSLTSTIGLLPTFGGVNLYMIIFSLIQLEFYGFAITFILVIILLIISYLIVLKYLLFDKYTRSISMSGGLINDLTLPNFFGIIVAIGLLILGFIPNIIASKIVENVWFIIS
ncbi:MAG: hypothetical protein FK730_09785 [Asgard group archaeon]|nr:hypothetical protein [Asgard group archaeon]